MVGSDDENALITSAKRGSATAKNELIRRYMPTLRQRIKVYSKAPIPQGALEGESIRLLLYAIQRYSPSKSVTFRTFLGHNLQGLYRYVNQHKNVARIPEHQVMQITRFGNTKQILAMDKGREPTREEMADSLGWSTTQVQRMESSVSRRDIAASGIEGLHEVERFDRRMDDLMEFEYFSMSPQEKLVYDYSMGRHGKIRLKSVKKIAIKTNLSTDQVYALKKKLAKKVLGRV